MTIQDTIESNVNICTDSVENRRSLEIFIMIFINVQLYLQYKEICYSSQLFIILKITNICHYFHVELNKRKVNFD